MCSFDVLLLWFQLVKNRDLNSLYKVHKVAEDSQFISGQNASISVYLNTSYSLHT